MPGSNSEARKRGRKECCCFSEIERNSDGDWDHVDNRGLWCWPDADPHSDSAAYKAQPIDEPEPKSALALANERIHVLDAALRALRGAMIVVRDELEPDTTIEGLATMAINVAADAVVWRPEEG
jgi:hypothetical protein